MTKVYTPDNYYYFGTKFLILVILIRQVYISLEGFWAVFWMALFVMMIVGIPFAIRRQTLVIDYEQKQVRGSFGRQINKLSLTGLSIEDKKLGFKRWTMLVSGGKKIFIPHEIFKVKTMQVLKEELARLKGAAS